MKKALSIVATLAVLSGTPLATIASDYPNQRVNLIAPFPAGGQTDILARLITTQLSERWKQPVTVDSRPGAGGIVGAEAVAKAPADGYTLLISANSIATYKLFSKDLRFDPLADLKPVSLIAWSPLVMLVPAQIPAKTLPEFIAYAKARPGQLNYGTFTFSAYDLDMNRLMQMAGIDMTPIAFNGGAPALQALLRNEIQMTFGQPSQSASFAEAGKLLVVATGSAQREKQRSNVPTLKENGIDLEVGAWYGIFVPAKVGDDVVAKLAADLDAVLKAPDTRSKIEALGFEVISSTPQRFAERLRNEARSYSETAQRLGVKPR